MDPNPIGYDIPLGTEEEGRQHLDLATPPAEGDIDVDAGMIRQFCALIEDANPSYWDAAFAAREWGGIPSPPAMLWAWCLNLMWTPDRAQPAPPLCGRIPLPGDTVVNFSLATEFRRPVLVGERLAISEKLTSLSPQKTTRLGTGHFLTTEADVTSAGETVGTISNVLFRFKAEQQDAPSPQPRPVVAPEGTPIPGYRLNLTLRKLVTTPAVTLDYFPGHYDPEYARANGHPTVFMNSMPLLGMVDRLVTEWAGPSAFITRHHLEFATSLYAGDEVEVLGWITGRRTGPGVWGADTEFVDIAVQLRKDSGAVLACQAGATVAVRACQAGATVAVRASDSGDSSHG